MPHTLAGGRKHDPRPKGDAMRDLCIFVISVALLVASTVTVAAGSDPQSRPATPSAGCGSSMAEPGLYSGSMEVAGHERSWELMIPSVHDGQAPVPLVVGLHGGSEFRSGSRLLKLAVEEGFVAAMPRDAYYDWWMVWEPQLPGYDLSLDNPDTAFVVALIDQLGEDLCLDLARVHGTGFCVGAGGLSVLGWLARRYSCEPEPAIEPLGEAQHYVWDCPEGTDVELIVHGGGHAWSSITDGRSTEQLVWDFFEQHSLPE